MCGICGIVTSTDYINPTHLIKMTRALRHRGPDDEGFALGDTNKNVIQGFHHDETIQKLKYKLPRLNNDLQSNLGFGFRRLSILDLSEHGHQPMPFEEAGLWIVFNGEIYNYIEIREELKEKGYNFNSNTDTEVILKAYHKWGADCVNKFNGMWAFAIWDSSNNKLFCSRDRFGIKPFYYHYQPDSQFIFASEIKAILNVVNPDPDKQIIFNLFNRGYSDHDENTFFENVKQLRGGHNLTLQNGIIKIVRYYRVESKPSHDSFDYAKNKLRELLYDSVRVRLRSDVPVGYALSGGIDSSSIVGIASRINAGSNNTFSMIYPGDIVDESFYIKKVIEKTGVNHHYISPSPEDFITDLNNFIWHQEEPFIGTSYYGEFKLRELTSKNNVTVSLEGQGADEIITGYTSLLLPYFYDLIESFNVYKFFKEYRHFKNSLATPAGILRSYLLGNSHNSNQDIGVKYPGLNSEYFEDVIDKDSFEKFQSGSRLNDALYEMLTYTSIPQQLVRADKNAMAFSVECRFPFLDYRVVEYLINLPFEYKTQNGLTKYLLREAMKDILPGEVYNRRDKVGFALPNSIFNAAPVKKYFYELISDIKDDDIPFLNKQRFIHEYFSNYNERNLDWKYWKTISLLLWYSRLQNNVQLINQNISGII